MVIHNPLTRSVFIVAAVWWLAFTAYAITTHGHFFFSIAGIGAALQFTTVSLVGWLVGTLLGVGIVVYKKINARIERHQLLKGNGRLGMMCTLGNMPVETGYFLKIRGGIPEWFFDESHVEYGPALKKWLDTEGQSYPQHAIALVACIKALCQFPDLPASHVKNGHGGRTLVDHSARVAALALKEARGFQYAGLVTKYGKEPPGDPGYTFDSEDPLIPLIAFAHDLGKLQTFMLDSNGNVVGSHRGHDAIGSRMLATMEEIKALPSDDQAAIHRAISFYHHPSAYPMDAEGHIGDDRSVALMMLLIKADKRAGKEEAGESLSPDEYAAYLSYMQDLGEELDDEEQKILSGSGDGAAVKTRVGGRAISDDEMKAVLLKMLLDPIQILDHLPKGKEYQAAIGQVGNTSYPQWAWDWMASGQDLDDDGRQRLAASIQRLIAINEPTFRMALKKRLGLTEIRKKGDGRYLITIQALRVLQQMGVLYTEADDGFISAESAYYVVNHQHQGDGRSLAEWKATILLKPVGPLERYATGNIHPSLIKVVRPLWKDRKGGAERNSEYPLDDTQDISAEEGTEVQSAPPESQITDQEAEARVVMPASEDGPSEAMEAGITNDEHTADAQQEPSSPKDETGVTSVGSDSEIILNQEANLNSGAAECAIEADDQNPQPGAGEIIEDKPTPQAETVEDAYVVPPPPAKIEDEYGDTGSPATISPQDLMMQRLISQSSAVPPKRSSQNSGSGSRFQQEWKRNRGFNKKP